MIPSSQQLMYYQKIMHLHQIKKFKSKFIKGFRPNLLDGIKPKRHRLTKTQPDIKYRSQILPSDFKLKISPRSLKRLILITLKKRSNDKIIKKVKIKSPIKNEGLIIEIAESKRNQGDNPASRITESVACSLKIEK
jgi:hypothetical protein